MTNSNWNPKDYVLVFPDGIVNAGTLMETPFIYKVSEVHKYILGAIIPEIFRSMAVDAELAGLVLSLALIDYIAGYFAGKQSSGEDYVNFTDNYFPNAYKPFLSSIYRDLRNGLMHNLASMNPWRSDTTIFFIHRDRPEHLVKMESGRVLFSVPIFAEDIRRSWIMFVYNLIMEEAKKTELRSKFLKRFNRLGGLGAYMNRIPE